MSEPSAPGAPSTCAPPAFRDPRWRREVLGWALPALAGHGLRLTGAVEQPRVRPWSTLLRLPTSGGPVWLKALAAGTRYEAALLAALARHGVDAVPRPLAVEAERGWVLLPDGGPVLRDAAGGQDAGWAAWESLLVRYGALQRAVAPLADELLALGVPDVRPAAVPGYLERLLEDPGVVAPEPARRVRALLPRVREWCAALDEGPCATLQHDDLHDGNVLARDGTVIDWGDASVAHPFSTLLVVRRVLLDRHPGEPHRVRRVVDAYLEGWDGDPAALRALVPVAERVGCVGRALAWQRALTGPGVEPAPGHLEAPGAWLQELLAEPVA
ncbi:phosphotransferase [Vallicoccus soli]|uniref:Aminoglycoside phosphotransferase family protein n=1 Tax=Vallicoccus soli TaxID=2339232 RepID=A0A3A3Z5I7_9ACTN|nr:phosphotransferase [Vallicoccus soli]RJK96978.1 aminoglycoside phosphotransferase family protein [Vallicoccus soli]